MVRYKEIAKDANVSIATVSRVINNQGYVSEKSRKKVKESLEKLKYKSLSYFPDNEKTGVKEIVFFVEDLLNPFYIMVYRGMVKKAQQYDMRVVLCGKFDFDNIEHFSNGIVFSNEFIAQYYLKNYGKRNDIFMMYLYTGSSFKLCQALPCVIVDMLEVLNKAIHYLRKKGKKKIWFASAVDDLDNIRIKAYMSKMEESMLTPKVLYVDGLNVYNSDIDIVKTIKSLNSIGKDAFSIGQEIAKKYMQDLVVTEKVAVICFNDELALGMYAFLTGKGYRIPEKIALLGIDGCNSRKYIKNSLATVNLFPEQQGEKCIELMHEKASGRKVHYKNYIRPQIIEGETV